MDIRCQSRKFGEASDDASGELRIVCTSRFCKQHGDEVVEHIFELQTRNKNGVVVPKRHNRFKRPK